MTHDDTIVAVASAPGGAARAIIRLCGSTAPACVQEFFHLHPSPLVGEGPGVRGETPPTLSAHVQAGVLKLPEFTAPVPCDLYVWPDARSYAKQPTVELHLPGAPPLVDAALAAACRAGARPAKPGEFTLRAFLAGRLDLTQAEAVLGVVDAADQKQLDVALRQMAGGLAAPLQKLRGDLLDVLAHLEAGLDFVEEPIEFIARDELLAQLTTARVAVQKLADQTSARGDATVVPRVVLVGEPNVGKSSLFNALAGTAAIVSPIAGTTRDYLTARLVLDGVECEFVDTAGVEQLDRTRPIAAAAQAFTGEQVREADVRLLCLDASRSMTPWEAAELSRPDPQRIVIRTKADVAASPHLPHGLSVSTVNGTGLDELRRTVRDAILALRPISGDVVATTAVRCRDSLHRAAAALAAAVQLVEHRGGEELIALELRHALDELGQVVGAVYTDDILDRIFSRFCIGK